MHKDTKYVLFLDDDVRIHPGTIGSVVRDMEVNPKVFTSIKTSWTVILCAIVLWTWSRWTLVFWLQIFVLTGFPFDIPTQRCLKAYCIYEYHMVLYCLLHPHDIRKFFWEIDSNLLFSVLNSFTCTFLPWNSFQISALTYVSTLLVQPCSIGFGLTGGRTFFLWGGFMMVICSPDLIAVCRSSSVQLE